MIRWFIIFLMSSFTAGGQINDEIIKVGVPKVMMKAGRQSVINVSVEVKNGYHIQAHEVKDEFIIPTTLEISENEEFIIQKQVFPAAKKFKLEGTENDLDVYNGKFEIHISFTTQKTIQKKVYHLNGKLKYQACDSMRCLFPKTVEFSVDVDVR